ncbi:MAG TPA: PilZ domain-containing protein [Acidobacteriota bacterium]|nr:PilZ domain-containing protein [Acidobacteriota bacterium]
MVINKREFFRLKLAVPFSFSVMKAQGADVPGSRTFHYQTQDLSGGGLRFETDLELVPRDELRLTLLLPEARPIEVTARVVWCQEVEVEEENMLVGGLEFVDIDQEEQDRIVGFLFKAQIEARHKRRQEREQFRKKGTSGA